LLDAARNKDESAVEELEGIFVDFFLGDFRSRLEKEKEGNFLADFDARVWYKRGEMDAQNRLKIRWAWARF
jgi:hypothetical protein